MKNSIFTSILAFVFPFAALAQTSRGTVTGLITDPSGAAVPVANVQLFDVERNSGRTTLTNEAGLYRFDALEPGSYRIAVAAGGFARFETRPFVIAAAQVATIDARLEVGEQTVKVEVSADAVILQTEAPVRGGTIAAIEASQLPVAGRNPVALALTLPGVSTNKGGFGVSTFSVNGARGRSNNFLLDGTENNDISVAGQAFEVTNPDAVAEVSVQTGNFDAEFGRSGGAVVNTIIRSGTNDLHGSTAYLIESTRFNALTNTQSLSPELRQRGRPFAGADQWFSGTVGGAIIKNKTFFFGAYQERRTVSTRTLALTTLSAAGRQTLRSVFPQGRSANADLYLSTTDGANANAQLSVIPLGAGRPDVEVGTYVRGFSQRFHSTQPIAKLDHNFSDRDHLTARFAFDNQGDPSAGFSGFFGSDTSRRVRFNNIVAMETHVFNPSLTNEFRLSYNRITIDVPLDPASEVLKSTPRINIQGLSAFGVDSTVPQGRIANNYVLQDTVNKIHGRHQLRAGMDLTMQRARQYAPFAPRGELQYVSSPGFTGFANFADDFGGANGWAAKDFGSPAYYPDMFRQAYFGQDRWRVRESLTLTLGGRYESFGTPMNSVPTPAYTGLFNIDPRTFTGPFSQPNRVAADRNNFAPVLGLAWSPSAERGLLGWLLGQKKTVWRMGYQIGYDSFYNNITSNAAASSPNLVSTLTSSVVDTQNPRGLAQLSRQFPARARPVIPADAQTLMLAKMVNPYYQRWSGGFQRQLPGDTVFEMSYVGSKGTKLYMSEDFNPLVPANFRILPAGVTQAQLPAGFFTSRLDSLQGTRTIRTNGGSSNYHSMQTEVRRRFAKGVLVHGSYTWSKFIDNGSEIFNWNTFTSGTLSALPSIFGGQPAERSLSSFDRTHRMVLSWVYALPFAKNQRGALGRAIGGWQVAGVGTFESGVPSSIINGVDADGFGGGNDRPLFNPNGQRNVRAQVSASSPTGFVNPEAGNAPIDPASAMYVQMPACNVTANPNGCRTGNLGRNTYRSPGINNFNVNLLKTTNLTERFKTELRAEFFNLVNHPQYGNFSASAFAPAMPAFPTNVAGSLPGRFLNPSIMDGGGRVMRFGLKVLF